VFELSVLIAARNERFLTRTIEDVLAHREADTEVIAVLDGEWADPPVPDSLQPVTLIHHATSIGQRAAVNEAAHLSTARYVMKLDAHCAVDQGFDRKLIEAYETREMSCQDVTIPRLYNLHAFDWECPSCHARVYQGAKPTTCATCKATVNFDRAMVWQPRWSRMTDFTRFDSQLHYQYWQEYKHRPQAQGDIADTMSQLGACFFLRRDRFWTLGGLDESHGSWGQVGTEMSCKAWLSGARQVVNKRTWYSHMFRTHGGPEWGFPYPMSNSQVDRARAHSRELWYQNKWPMQVRPLAWIINHFWPIPDWDQPEGAEIWARVREAGGRFQAMQAA
jgi:hypothetical protein